jgi:TetR/AcrR family transcriptional regulator, cholesterol catabolism regulator
MATQRRTPQFPPAGPANAPDAAPIPPGKPRTGKPDSDARADGTGRRAEMCRAAAQLFRDRGFDATSVSDIARTLGLTKAGLYHHFESKEALLFEIMTFGLERVRDEVVVPVRAIRDPEERLRQLIVRHARIATRGHGAVAHLGDEIRALPPASRKQIEQKMRLYFDLVRNTLVELRTAGRLHPVDVTVAAFSVLGMILWLPRWFRQDGRLTQEEVAGEIANLALGGLIQRRRSTRQRRGLQHRR